ncbi:MAG: RNA 2',3'-cyclic phosphodiesterase [bacterium]
MLIYSTIEMPRLFYAIDLPEELKAELIPVVSSLGKLGRHVRPVGAGGFHLTLLFLGEQPDEVVEDFRLFGGQVTEGARASRAEIGEAGFFPRVSFLTLEGELDTIFVIADVLKTLCTGYLERPDDRPFKLHITLARHKQNISGTEKEFIKKQTAKFKGRSWEIDRLILFESKLTPKGAVYTEQGVFKFGG